MKDIPNCNPQQLKDLSLKLTEFAMLWKQSDVRPDFSLESKSHWDKLIEEWANDISLPLFIRKQSLGRGIVIHHKSGRKLIPTDNSPANWACVGCLLEKDFSISNIEKLLNEDKIPVALVWKKDELKLARYKCRLSNENINKKGWKIAHVKPVGMGQTVKKDTIEDLDIKELVSHFIDFMKPSNMFFIPKQWSGVAEAQEVLDVFKDC